MKKLIVGILLIIGIQVVNAEYVSKETLMYHKAYKESNPYTLSGYYGQCTWYAWGRMFEKTNTRLPVPIGNAGEWIENIGKEYKRDQIEENSVLVIGKGSYSSLGHVVFIEEIKGEDVYITEGNYNGKGDITGYRETIKKKSDLKVGNPYYKNQSNKILGFIVSPEKKYKPTGNKIDLGDKFIASILPKFETSYALSILKRKKDSFASLQKLEEKKNQKWIFKRQQDGSYRITNTDTKMDLFVKAQEENKENSWFLYEYNGGYRFVPKTKEKEMLAMDIPNNEYFENHILQLYEAINAENKAQTFQIEKQPFNITYNSHIENIGWTEEKIDGEVTGSIEKNLRLEAFQIHLENGKEEGDIEYISYVKGKGWEPLWKKNGEVSGTTGNSLRIEAIRIRLTKEIKEKYDIYYRVFLKNVGWLDWAKNGELAGSFGLDLQIEGLEVTLLKKEDNTNLKKERHFLTETSLVSYETHIENIGWEEKVTFGKISGLPGSGLRIEAIKIDGINPHQKSGEIIYRSYIETLGWENTWKKNGEVSGTTGESRKIEALEIKLTKELEKEYDIFYRVYMEKLGWLPWMKNGETAGLIEKDFRIEAIQISLEKKG